MDRAEARDRLNQAGISLRDVHLPGEEPAIPRQGVVVVRNGAQGWEVVSEEYGDSALLARASTEDEALEYAVERVTAPRPAPRPVDAGLIERARTTMAQLTGSVRSTLAQSSAQVAQATLWDGAVVDRFGTLDGFLLWPEGTPLAERSLPPDAIDRTFPHYGRVVLGCAAEIPVLVRVTAPWFGQPGGAVVMRLEPDVTVRDLVASGRLVVLDVPD
jgi:hypothetical protein